MSKLAHSHQETMDELDTKRLIENGDEDLVQKPAQPVTALALIENMTAVQVFSENGLDPLIDRIERDTRTIALDVSTKKGREQIASLSYMVAKSKTALDKMGQDLVADWKKNSKKVDAERSRAWHRLEALQKEIRQPLTEWEDREKNRVAKHEADLAEIAEAGRYTAANWQSLSVESMNDRLKELLTDKTDWQEFSVRVKLATEAAVDAIATAILKRQKHDSEQAELARLRKEEEERKQREHEERLKAEAAEKARLEAEEKARKEAAAEAARVAAEKAKTEQELQRIQREKDAAEAKAKHAAEEAAAREATIKRQKEEAEARAAQAEKDHIAAQEKAMRDAEQAEKRRKHEAEAAEEKRTCDVAAAQAKAKRDAEDAAKKERASIDVENKARAEAKSKREADEAHRASIEQEAIAAFLSELQQAELEDAELIAQYIVSAIKIRKIPHINISY